MQTLWRTCSIASGVMGMIALVLTSYLLVRRIRLVNQKRFEYFDAADELMNKPQSSVSKPLVPVLLTQVGSSFAILIFGCAGLFLRSTPLSVPAQIFVSFALAAAGEICASIAVYVYRLRKDNNIIFIPKAAGYFGKVFTDIPSGKQGVGSIRIFMNGQVVSVAAMTVDEVRLARGTDVRILYAEDDRMVVVERVVDQQNPFDRI